VNRKDNPLLHFFPKVDPGSGKRWALEDQDRAALNGICAVLNAEAETHRELRSHLRAWVGAWQASGPNLKKLFESLPVLQRTALSVAMRAYWIPTDGAKAMLRLAPDWDELRELGFGDEVQVGPEGKQIPFRVHDPNPAKMTPEGGAMALFHLLTINPGCGKIAGPCPRCDRYYIKKRASQKVYCSRRCGNAATAVVRTRERIASERREKLARAKAALKKWERATTRQDWKEWVAKKTGIDPRFLTRAKNKGDLVPPTKEK
jgi:hypothetical protein